MTQYAAVIDLAALDGPDGFRIDGEANVDFSGAAVASAGDVNGDGFDDLIIGARGADPHGSESGAAYVVFGHGGGFGAVLDLSRLHGSNGFQISGVAAGDHAGISVSSAGDVNGDGYADLIVGAYTAGSNYTGASYVVYGHASGFSANLNLSSLDGANGFKINAAASGDRSGGAVASAGDVNGDGVDDLIVGAFGAGPHVGFSGAAYVVFGRTTGFGASFDLASLDGANGFRISGAAAGDNVGAAVSSAGDVNGDGVNDLIVGAYQGWGGDKPGVSYVIFGKTTGFSADIDLASLNGTDGFSITGVTPGDRTGSSVSYAGDVNGDGYADLIVGAPGAGPAVLRGAGYVVFGQASGFAANIDLANLDGTDGFKIRGAAWDESGWSVGSAGDINGDGFGDVIVGGPDAEGQGDYPGRSYVIYGKAAPFPAVFDVSRLNGANGFELVGAPHDTSGQSVAYAGDVNGDGLGDLVIGAPGASIGTGATYVVFGRLPDAAVHRTGSAASQTILGGDFSDKLSGLGGDDRLIGHGGADRLYGGTGDDAFVYAALSDSTRAAPDQIFDFTAGDRIDLSAIDADKATPGDQAFHLGAGGHAGDVRVSYDAVHDRTIVDLYVNDDTVIDARIWLAGDHHAIAAGDFVL